MKVLQDFFWPKPPKGISAESRVAMKADLNELGLLSVSLGVKNRSAVDVWTRHKDNLNRTKNREWMRIHGVKFVRRWVVIAGIGWVGAFSVSGVLWLEVPLVMLGIIAVGHAVFFQYLRHIKDSLNT